MFVYTKAKGGVTDERKQINPGVEYAMGIQPDDSAGAPGNVAASPKRGPDEVQAPLG